jgi:hypothetical protein
MIHFSVFLFLFFAGVFILELIYDIFNPLLCISKLSCSQINIEEN